jgi:DNA-binding transcriptional ArsR family regulator
MFSPSQPIQPPTIIIEARPAYEFLQSLCVFSMYLLAGGKEYEAGDSWFQVVRAKSEMDRRIAPELFMQASGRYLLGLASDCPLPRDVPTLLASIEAIDPVELCLGLSGYYARSLRRIISPTTMLQAIEGNQQAQSQFLQAVSDDSFHQQGLRYLFSHVAKEISAQLLTTLQQWYSRVFRDMEPEVMPILERDAQAKRELRQSTAEDRFIEVATNGYDYIPEPFIHTIVLAPSFIGRPYIALADYHDRKIFCYPVADESLTVDKDAPPERLVRLYKVLGDERRLRILKKLTTGSFNLQEIADDFGVGKSTMHHHMVMLRSAGLVRLRSSDKRYSLRQEMIPGVAELLSAYLK